MSLISTLPLNEKTLLETPADITQNGVHYEYATLLITQHFIIAQTKRVLFRIHLFNISDIKLETNGDIRIQTSHDDIVVSSDENSSVHQTISEMINLSTVTPKNNPYSFSYSQQFQFRFCAQCSSLDVEYCDSVVSYYHQQVSNFIPVFDTSELPPSAHESSNYSGLINAVLYALIGDNAFTSIAVHDVQVSAEAIKFITSNNRKLETLTLINCTSDESLPSENVVVESSAEGEKEFQTKEELIEFANDPDSDDPFPCNSAIRLFENINEADELSMRYTIMQYTRKGFIGSESQLLFFKKLNIINHSPIALEYDMQYPHCLTYNEPLELTLYRAHQIAQISDCDEEESKITVEDIREASELITSHIVQPLESRFEVKKGHPIKIPPPKSKPPVTVDVSGVKPDTALFPRFVVKD